MIGSDHHRSPSPAEPLRVFVSRQPASVVAGLNFDGMALINLHRVPTEALKIKICGVDSNNHLTCATAGGCLVGGLPCLFLLPACRRPRETAQRRPRSCPLTDIRNICKATLTRFRGHSWWQRCCGEQLIHDQRDGAARGRRVWPGNRWMRWRDRNVDLVEPQPPFPAGSAEVAVPPSRPRPTVPRCGPLSAARPFR